MVARHANWRAEARFLFTKAEPKLVSWTFSPFLMHVVDDVQFYLPCKLSSEEEDRLARQADDAEARIAREADEFKQKHAAAVAAGEADDVTVALGRIESAQKVPHEADGKTVVGAKANGDATETLAASADSEGGQQGPNGHGHRDGGDDERESEHETRVDGGGTPGEAAVKGKSPRRSDSPDESKAVGDADGQQDAAAADGTDQNAADGEHDSMQHGEMVEEAEDTVLF